MVMETPSAQCVGREFVRQYYTLLHEAPEYLHRFYSHNSCFVHGGVEKPGEEQPPVQGQADIHKKILSLNFCDCHAKIRQVDSQSTVGNAVVVQVTGELSNNGQPMRRFMQTFILAPQSPKKYYVHNDIFRYQDEVFHDNDTDTDIQEDIPTEEQFHDSDTEQGDIVAPVDLGQQSGVCDVPSFYKEPDSQQGQPPPILSNGNAISEDRPDTPEEEKCVEEPEEKVESENETPAVEFEAVLEPEKLPEAEEEPRAEQVQESKPISWASVTSKNTSGSSSGMVNKQVPVAPKAVPVHQQPASKPMEKPDPLRDGPKPPREQRDPRDTRPPRRDRESSRGTGEPEEFRRSRYPDTHQLFVGNLPHNIQEKELKQHFENFGKVVEVRINRKSNSRDVPNFGFVVFEDPQTVLTVLDSKPIMFRGEHRLNVEEKKQRSEQMARPVSGNRMARGGGPGGPGMGRMGGPGGPGGRGGRGGGPGRSERGGMSDRGRGGSGRGEGGGFGAPRR